MLKLAEGKKLFHKIIKKTRLNKGKTKLHFFKIAPALQEDLPQDLKPEKKQLCLSDK